MIDMDAGTDINMAFAEGFEDDDLIEELERRGKYNPSYGDSGALIDKIYHARRQGKPYEHLLDELLYMKTGRAV